MPAPVNRRTFLQRASASAAGISLAATLGAAKARGGTKGALAALGGKPVRTEPFPSWPVVEKNDREAWQKVLEEGKWCRLDGNYANTFEKVYAELTGTSHCTATANGTSAAGVSRGPGEAGTDETTARETVEVGR